MSKSEPGILSTIAALIGVLGYIFADIYAFAALDVFADNPESFGEGIGQLLAGAIVMIISFFFEIFAMIFSLLGSISRQSKLIVTISLVAFVIIFYPFGLFTLAALSSVDEVTDIVIFLVLWAMLLGMLSLHIKGLRQ